MQSTDVDTVANVSQDMLGMPQQKKYLDKCKDEVFNGCFWSPMEIIDMV